MATKKKSAKQNGVNTTFAVSSLSSTAGEENLLCEVEENKDGEDGPVVFICGKCKLPVGDSMSWDGTEDEENQIRLKRESAFVKIFKILK